MGISFDQSLRENNGSLFIITIATNEDNGTVGYGLTTVVLSKKTLPIRGGGGGPVHDTLAPITPVPAAGVSSLMLFSDRNKNGQPFDMAKPEPLSLSVTFGLKTEVRLHMLAWWDHTFQVAANSDFLVGVGPSLSGRSPNAVYTFSIRKAASNPA